MESINMIFVILSLLIVTNSFVRSDRHSEIQQSVRPDCSVTFENKASDNFIVEKLKLNTYHIRLIDTTTNSHASEDEIDGDLKRHFGSRHKVPPTAKFRCTGPNFIKLQISSVSGIQFIETNRRRLVPSTYNPMGLPNQISQQFEVDVILTANSTGDYIFYNSDNPDSNTRFFLFSQTERTELLGVGRRLKGFFTGNNILVPCVSPNPKSLMFLWKFNSEQNSFDKLSVDNETIFYNSESGFFIQSDSHRSDREINNYYRCTIQDSWHSDLFVDIDVKREDPGQHHSELTINLIKLGGGAECYGIENSGVKFYKVDANEDVAPTIVKCFEQGEFHCGDRPFNDEVVVGSPLNPDVSGKASVSVLRFTDSYGLLICVSETEVIYTTFFKGLDGIYYRNGEDAPIDALLRIQLVPDPDKEVIIGGSVITVGTNQAPSVFIDNPRLMYTKFRNGSFSRVLALTEDVDKIKSINILVTSEVTGVIVNDQIESSGKTINVTKNFTVTPKACGHHQFKCASDECIPIAKRCDHHVHCRDGKSDEIDCTNYSKNCTDMEFRCKSGQCISKSLFCSGTEDCHDGSGDGHICSVCGEGRFRCNSGDCIRDSYVCDSDIDCDDGSDESNELCKHCNGNSDKFKCLEGGCINKDRVCDGYINCEDGSDEVGEVCKGVIPVIVNRPTNYSFPRGEDSYLVCEVAIPANLASQSRFEPRVNWSFTKTTNQNTESRLVSSNKQIKDQRVSKSNSRQSSEVIKTYFFVYKLERLNEEGEGRYTCEVYNEVGSTYKKFVVTIQDCPYTNPITPRPSHQVKPVEDNEDIDESVDEIQEQDFECRKSGKYPDPVNCSVFHECVPTGKRFIHHKYACGPGTVFCRDLQQCGWEADCPCARKINNDNFETELKRPTKGVGSRRKVKPSKTRNQRKKIIFGGR